MQVAEEEQQVRSLTTERDQLKEDLRAQTKLAATRAHQLEVRLSTERDQLLLVYETLSYY
jgi:hypothetical protein